MKAHGATVDHEPKAATVGHRNVAATGPGDAAGRGSGDMAAIERLGDRNRDVGHIVRVDETAK